MLFMKNYTQNVVEKLILDLFLKIKMQHISGLTVWNFIQFVFIVCLSWRLVKCIQTMVLNTAWKVSKYGPEKNPSWDKFSRSGKLAFSSYRFFLGNKRRSGSSLPFSFSAWFWRKILLMLCSINWPNFIVWLPLIFEILGNTCIATIFFRFMTSDILKLTSASWSRRFRTWTKNSWQKFKYLKNEKSF